MVQGRGRKHHEHASGIDRNNGLLLFYTPDEECDRNKCRYQMSPYITGFIVVRKRSTTRLFPWYSWWTISGENIGPGNKTFLARHEWIHRH